jgi:heme O synthase-like polyprenyltransferase
MFEDCNKTHTGGGKRLMTSTRKRVPTRQPIQIRRRVQALWFGSTLLAFGLLSATGCAVNPATGQRQFMLISESEEI